MDCYSPAERQVVLFKEHVTLHKISREEDLERVKLWLSRWNRQFLVSEETLPLQYKSKAVKSTSSPNRRLLLEVFQYLNSREVELTVAFTCKAWFHTTRDNELWKTRYLAQFPSSAAHRKPNYRTQFIVWNRRCCWLCGCFVQLDSLQLLCPLHARPLCMKCAQTEQGRIVPLNSYFNERHVTRALAARLNFPYFMYNSVKQNYASELGNIIIPYAEQRRKALLKALYSRPIRMPQEWLGAIFNFDLQAFYKGREPLWMGIAGSMGVFCGKDDEKEDFAQNLLDFF